VFLRKASTPLLRGVPDNIVEPFVPPPLVEALARWAWSSLPPGDDDAIFVPPDCFLFP